MAKHKPDYWLKSVVLNEKKGLIDVVKDSRRYDYLICTEQFDKITLQLEWANEHYYQVKYDNLLLFNEAIRIVNADRQRTKRLRNRISNYLNGGNCLFLTLTFNNECLANTTEQTRREYVRKWLKSYSSKYIANIDYGKKNGREHYHAIIQVDSVDFTTWTHGTCNGQRVKSTHDDLALSKYICKLTNHAIKNTTKRKALIYGEIN